MPRWGCIVTKIIFPIKRYLKKKFIFREIDFGIEACFEIAHNSKCVSRHRYCVNFILLLLIGENYFCDTSVLPRALEKIFFGSSVFFRHSH